MVEVQVVADTLTHPTDEPTAVTCRHCEYVWDYSGEMQMATCPSCQRKTPVDPEADRDA